MGYKYEQKKIEWVFCEEDTPLVTGSFQYCSDNVIGLTESGKELEVFYNYRNDLWYSWDTSKPCTEEIVKWRSK